MPVYRQGRSADPGRFHFCSACAARRAARLRQRGSAAAHRRRSPANPHCRTETQTAQDLLGTGRRCSGHAGAGKIAPWRAAQRWPYPPGGSPPHSGTSTVAARSTHPHAPRHPDHLDRTHHYRGTQPPSAAHERGGRFPDPAAGACRGRAVSARWPRPRGMARGRCRADTIAP